MGKPMRVNVLLLSVIGACGQGLEAAESSTGHAAAWLTFDACAVVMASPHSGPVGEACPAAGTVVNLPAGTTQLSTECSYRGVTFFINQSSTTLDCNGRLLEPGATLVDGSDPSSRQAIEITGNLDDPAPIKNVEVRNCFIRGYTNGVGVGLALTPRKKRELRDIHWATPEPDRYLRLMSEDDALRALAPRDVRLRDVHIEGTLDVGVYVYPWVQGVTLERVSVRGTESGPGVYLDSGSRGARLIDSCVRNAAREGIAIDSSAFNRVSGCHLYDNTRGGIFLYRNANENVFPADMPHEREPLHQPRSQHSEGNLIEENLFENEVKAVFVASRASLNRAESSLYLADSPVFDRVVYLSRYLHHRDYAEANRIRRNEFRGTREVAVVIEDDHTLVTDNYFESVQPGDTAIYLGSRVRRWVGDPIYGNEIRGNVFHENVREEVQQEYCAVGSLIVGNKTLRPSGMTEPYKPGPAACDDDGDPFRDPLGIPNPAGRLHPALLPTVLFR